jgi:hypothetical protein
VRWPFGSQAEAEPCASGHRSLALKALLDGLRPGSPHTVLDLGPGLGPNIDFLARLACRVRVADLLWTLLGEPKTSREPIRFASLLSRLLPLPEDERLDAVLAWNVFDYLRPDQIASLMTWLSGACRPGARVLALVSTRREIPARPLRYSIVDRENVACYGPLHPLRPCPRHPPTLLVRAMPGFSVEATFLMRNGIQEYLFASRG